MSDQHKGTDEGCGQVHGRDRRRMRPEDRCCEILDAALAVFSESGFGNASLNDVAERAGVTKGCLYHYFESKEQLLLALMRSKVTAVAPCGGVAEAVPSTTGTEETLETATVPLDALIERIWRHYQRPGQIELTTLAINELPKFPEVGRVLFTEVVVRGRETLRRSLEDARRQRDPAQEIPQATIEAVASVIPYMIMGVALGQHLFKGIDPMELSEDELGSVVTNMLLHGV